MVNEKLAAPVVAMASANKSLVMVGADGGVFPIGHARYYGSLGGKRLAGRIVGVATDPGHRRLPDGRLGRGCSE